MITLLLAVSLTAVPVADFQPSSSVLFVAEQSQTPQFSSQEKKIIAAWYKAHPHPTSLADLNQNRAKEKVKERAERNMPKLEQETESQQKQRAANIRAQSLRENIKERAIKREEFVNSEKKVAEARRLSPRLGKNLTPGKAFPADVPKETLPLELLAVLPPAPSGFERKVAGPHVFLIRSADHQIVDVLRNVVK